ncbi:MAG: DUF2550 family protein [Pseudonocardiaceae bacterium]|nr:DUF2550 family protein [Pseudonocardiaceae bacterium]
MGIAEIAGLVLLGVAMLFAVLAYRRVRLVRGGGIDVALRARPYTGGRGWHLGVARYRGDQFAWYRVSSLRSGPDRVLHRERLVIVERRDPTLPESYSVPPGSVVLRCGMADGEFELAMGRDTLTGFLSWLESAPPGRGVHRAS